MLPYLLPIPQMPPKKNHPPCTSACTASKKNAGMSRGERSYELLNYMLVRIAKAIARAKENLN